MELDCGKNATECHYLWNCAGVSNIDRSIVYKNVQLVVHTINPIITENEGKMFYFHSMEEQEHKRYFNMSKYNRKKRHRKGASMTYAAIQISSDDGTFSDTDVPSTVLVDALADIFESGFEQHMIEASKDLLVMTRECVASRMPDSYATVDKHKLIKRNVRNPVWKSAENPDRTVTWEVLQ